MRNIIRTVGAVVMGLCLMATAACGDETKAEARVPVGLSAQQIADAQLLNDTGYTAAHTYRVNGMAYGYVYVACGDEMNVSKCGVDRLDKATAQRPNFYVTKYGTLTQLEGPHGSPGGDHNYRCTIPKGYENLRSLTVKQYNELLRLMDEVIAAIGTPTDGRAQIVKTSIGDVTVSFARAS